MCGVSLPSSSDLIMHDDDTSINMGAYPRNTHLDAIWDLSANLYVLLTQQHTYTVGISAFHNHCRFERGKNAARY